MDEISSGRPDSGEHQLPINIDKLPEALGFAETPELRSLREELVESITKNEDRLVDLELEYVRLAREVIGQPIDVRVDEEDYTAARPRIGLMIAQALIWRDAGRIGPFASDLFQAQKAAKNWSRGAPDGMEFKQVADTLAAVLLEMGIQPERPYYNPENQPVIPGRDVAKIFEKLLLRYENVTPPVQTAMRENALLVNGKILEASDESGLLWQALTRGKDTIRKGLEDFKQLMEQRIPDAEVTLAPFEVVHLGKEPDKTLTEYGLSFQDNVVYNRKGLREDFQHFWLVVLSAGYVPEVRIQNFSKSDKQPEYRVGLWARLPEVVEPPKTEE